VEAVASAGAQVLVQLELGEDHLGVELADFGGGLVAEDHEHQRDEAANDVGVAVGEPVQLAFVGPADDPDLAHAALHFVSVDLQLVGHGRQLGAQLDQVAVLLRPIIEKGEGLADVVEGLHGGGLTPHGPGRYRRSARGSRDSSSKSGTSVSLGRNTPPPTEMNLPASASQYQAPDRR